MLCFDKKLDIRTHLILLEKDVVDLRKKYSLFTLERFR